MSSFSITRKKTPFQKHREEEEAKKKRAEDETARLYAEFVESFQGDTTPGSKTFVRGGTINPNDRFKDDSEGEKSKDGVSVPKKGSRYVPSFIPPPIATKGKESERKKEEEKPKEKEKGKSRNIDHFMEELKHEQEMRERRNQEREHWRDGRHAEHSAQSSRFDELPDDFDPSGKLPGSFDDGDPQTTNLYVGNLSPKVDENFLLRTFGRFGPIASVKIMWPRTEEERRRQRNCGFVAFMNRADGQAAKDEMQGVVVYEYELKIGWGRTVALPSQALPAPPPGHMAIRSKEGSTVILSGPSGPPLTSVPNQNSELVLTPNVPDIMVTPPEDEHLRHVIDTMALYVLDGGCAFEQAIMERGRGNPLFNFLFVLGSKEHTYYVWRLYSFAQGDTLQRWRTEPFIMITGSGRWIPPSLPTSKSPEHEKESGSTHAGGRSRRVEPERTLTDAQRDEFEDMLRALTLERSQIKEAMGFSLDNADAAGEIVEVLTESLTLKETPIPTKIARLMLVSDILHNSSAPVRNASAYRTKFEATLPDIMESFNDLYRSIMGRITAEALKERVLKVLQVWADWFLFSDSYVNGLRATFLRPGNSGVSPFHSICGDAPEIEQKTTSEDIVVGGKTNQDAALAMGRGAAMKELMSLPIAELERRCRHNGLSLVGGREMMVARLLSLEEAEKQRGYELDDELKYAHNQVSSGKYSGNRQETSAEPEPVGLSAWNHYGDEDLPSQSRSSVSIASTLPIPQPELKAFTKKEKSDPVLPASKWAREDDESDDEQRRGGKNLGLSYSSSGSDNVDDGLIKADESESAAGTSFPAHTDSGMNEEQRQKLRRLEVALIEYRESLEERGIKNLEEIDKKVESHRKRLQAEYGLSDSGEDGKSNRRTTERRDRHDVSRKRHRSRSPSDSPQPKLSGKDKDREHDLERDRDRQRDKSYDFDIERGKDRHREKSGSRERDDHDKDRSRDRDRDRRRRTK
ncbi:protein RRC1 isoform X1 [Vigna unguiculata]|uniref:protein RRC1 isoform X1 n=2 Tax=Vigna unguiculata TaxID=3917 RepID=UPI001016CF6C|nr:protein RRC1 isoform X1 [Vigna unguiculata]XP_027917350.1 protein RRC1 isoform X1 [Vigna unguiculata]XP_027917351.1 protein RRC1 isoform X1 [Vigna unguiculata]XP_027917352.1 protein RRC1 isoform X1 [Vigna unguiculata]XP_027917353.1 protein RRC1 isoform X1 [Vigna unguiculata]